MALLIPQHRVGARFLAQSSLKTVVILKKDLASERFALLPFNAIPFIKERASGWLG